MKVLLIHGHPNPEAFNRALADAYLEGAAAAGADVRVVDLSELTFDPVLRKGYAEIQPLEPDLIEAQKALLWADHLVLAFPVWWGAAPALLKGFLDRTFLPGFAFRFPDVWPLPEKLLRGRSAHVIVTMDSPRPIYSLLYRDSAHRSVVRGTLQFCGFHPITTSDISAVKYLPEAWRERSVRHQRRLGETFVRRQLRPPFAKRLWTRLTEAVG
ncbi:MAG: NAD(P)H-dependent oxidoreductase [Myxococcota bacterium]